METDEITSAITESIADIEPDVDTTVDTAPDVAETAPSSVAAAPDAGAAPRPMSRSQKRITDLIEQGKTRDAEWATKEAAWNAQRDSLKWAIDDPNAQGLYNGLRLMDDDPGRFVEHVLLKDERYQGLIQMRQAQAAAEAAAEVPQQGGLKEPNFPDADLQYPDGSPAHSPEVIAKYVKDVAAYATQQAESKMGEKVGALEKLVAPFLKERADSALADKAFDQQTKAFDRIVNVYGPKATEMKGLMHAWVKNQWAAGKKGLTIQDAVEAVLVPALRKEAEDARNGVLSAADNTRKQGIADTNTRAAASERTSAAAGAAEESGDPIENAIRGAIRGLAK